MGAPEEVEDLWAAFVAFVARVARGDRTDWHAFAVAHYGDRVLEHARSELVRVALVATESELRSFAAVLYDQLRSRSN